MTVSPASSGRAIVCKCGSDDLEFAACGGRIISTDINNFSRAGDDHCFGSYTRGIGV